MGTAILLHRGAKMAAGCTFAQEWTCACADAMRPGFSKRMIVQRYFSQGGLRAGNARQSLNI
jgi:hypothetical protein